MGQKLSAAAMPIKAAFLDVGGEYSFSSSSRGCSTGGLSFISRRAARRSSPTKSSDVAVAVANSAELFDAEIETPGGFEDLLQQPQPDRTTRLKHAWNPDDRSFNIFVKEDNEGFTVHRQPVAQSTDCIRGRVGYERGLHVWKIRWSHRHRGTHAVVGVATRDAPLHCTGYRSLVGSTDDSWGWDLCRNRLLHSSPAAVVDSDACPVHSPSSAAAAAPPCPVYPDAATVGPAVADGFVAPDEFLVVLDMDAGTLGFATVDGRYFGTAFDGLRSIGQPLYPIVSAVWGHCEITINYVGSRDAQPMALCDLSRRAIRRQLRRRRLSAVYQLPLPTVMKRYIVWK